MVWGCISIDGRTDLVALLGNLTAAGYIEQILLQHVLAAYGVGPEFVLMHDNGLCSENWTFKRWNGRQ
jgi:hypothetical protein